MTEEKPILVEREEKVKSATAFNRLLDKEREKEGSKLTKKEWQDRNKKGKEIKDAKS